MCIEHINGMIRMEERLCTKCNQIKPLSDFPQRKKTPVGFRDAAQYSPCKTCNAERAKEWRSKNKGYRGSGRMTKYQNQPLISAIRTRLREAKERIKKFGKPDTDLTEEYLYELFNQQNGKCALLGYDMKVERKHPLALSLDQIEPSKGYVIGNVQWVTWISNRAKGDMNQDDFYRMCELAIEYRNEQRLSRKGVEPSGSKRTSPEKSG